MNRGGLARRLILAGAMLAPPLGSFAAATDDRLPEIAVANEQPGAGDIVDGNLLVPTPSTWAGGQIEITLTYQNGLGIWFRAPSDSCDQARPAFRKFERAPLTGDAIFAVCVQKTSAGAGRALASVVYRPATGPPITRAVSSPAIALEGHELSAAWLALLGAGFGFLGGILTQVFQSWWQGKQEERKASHAIVETVTKALVSEISTNRQRLQDYLASLGTTTPRPAEPLEIGRYDGMFTTKGVLAFLKAAERRTYLEKLDAVYAIDIARYNAAVARDSGNQAVLGPLARDLEPRLGAFMS
jgi:hypothetical protein